MTKCLGPLHDFDGFTTFTTSRLVIDLETLPLSDYSKIYSAQMRKHHKAAKFLDRLQVVKVVQS